MPFGPRGPALPRLVRRDRGRRRRRRALRQPDTALAFLTRLSAQHRPPVRPPRPRPAASGPSRESSFFHFSSVEGDSPKPLKNRLEQTLSDYKAVLADLFYVGDAGSVAPGGRRKTVVIVDGVDQLEDFADRADLLSSWMPRRLPAHVKLILTLRSGPHVQHLQSLLADSGAFYQVQTCHNFDAEHFQNPSKRPKRATCRSETPSFFNETY